MIRVALASLLLVGACSPPNRLFEPVPFPTFRGLTCTLNPVHQGVLNPTYFRDRGSDTLTLTFSDFSETSARVNGNIGSETVEVSRTANQMHFIETTLTDNMTVTTLYAPPEPGEPMPMVHSRHIQIAPANVSISQFAGECVPS